MNPISQIFNHIKEKLNGETIYDELEKSSPQFKKFADDIDGKSIEDIALEYDLDANLLRQFL